MKNLFINVNCWGNDYVDSLLNYTITCLYHNFKILNRMELKRITFCICTDSQGIKKIEKNILFKKIRLLINCEFINIEEPIKKLKKKTNNKYQLLSCIQNLMINLAYKRNYKFFMTLYPDFLFKKETIKNLLKITKREDQDILLPIPQLIKEDVIHKIKKKGFEFIIDNLAEINFEMLHEIILNNNINDLQTNTPSLFCQIEDTYINFSNYHIHPIVIKLNDNRFKYLPFVKSLDEDFIKSLSYEKKYYVIKNSDEILMNSLLGKNELPLIKQKFDAKQSIIWLESKMYKINIEFSKSIYTIFKKKNKKKTFETKKIKIFNKPINESIRYQMNCNKYDTISFISNSFFLNIRDFLFDIQKNNSELDEKEFNSIILKNKLGSFKHFLKIFNLKDK